MKGYLLRLGARRRHAEDLAQDAMVSIWRRAASFDAAKSEGLDLDFRDRAECMDRPIPARKNANWPIARSLDSHVKRAMRNRPTTQPCAGEIGRANLKRRWSLLSEEQRQVVRFSFFEDRPHSEIAERLSLPLGTVKSRSGLALIKLRAHWEQYQVSPQHHPSDDILAGYAAGALEPGFGLGRRRAR